MREVRGVLGMGHTGKTFPKAKILQNTEKNLYTKTHLLPYLPTILAQPHPHQVVLGLGPVAVCHGVVGVHPQQ